jgi:hypothetical protein
MSVQEFHAQLEFRGEDGPVLKLYSFDRLAVLFSNPWPSVSQIKFARAREIGFMSFDNELELRKMKKHFPAAKLMLTVAPGQTMIDESQAGSQRCVVCSCHGFYVRFLKCRNTGKDGVSGVQSAVVGV